MSLEGRIRDVGLPEVCQLLALSRKSGTLRLRAPLLGLSAEVLLSHGAIVDVTTRTLDVDRQPLTPEAPAHARALTERMLELLEWTDGEFAFAAADAPTASPTGLRVALDRVLVEAAERADGWARVRDRVPHAGVVPTYVDAESEQLPLLRLVPQEWAILTRVDGHRTVVEIATLLQRDALEIATLVHALIGAGVLTLRVPVARCVGSEKSAAGAATASEPQLDLDGIGADLWIPDDATDIVFDPDALTELMHGSSTNASGLRADDTDLAVASPSREPSLLQRTDSRAHDATAATILCRRGDDAARHGDLAAALEHWREALRCESLPTDGPASAARMREAVSLAARLQVLLHAEH